MKPQLNVGLIVEYLAAVWSVRLPNATAEDFTRANALGMRCMIELPNAAWTRIVDAVADGGSNKILCFVAELRGEAQPDEPLLHSHYVWHSPGIGLGGGAVAPVPTAKRGLARRVLHAILDDGG